MKTLLILAALLPSIALADVVIVRKESSPAACPRPEPQLIKQTDGSYATQQQHTITLAMCWSFVEWRERWTDYPENGGAFVERVTETK